MSTEEWAAERGASEWGVKPKTWHSYVARGFAPKPVRRVGRTPVWDAAEVRSWPRPGRGARTDLTNKERDVTDPTAIHPGTLVMSGWIAETPDTGRDGAFLLLTTPDSQASVTMPRVAKVLGFDPRRGAMTATPSADVRVEIEACGGELWATLTAHGQKFTRPVSGEWGCLAREHGRVILVVGYAPSRGDEAPDAYIDRVLPDSGLAFGIVPAA